MQAFKRCASITAGLAILAVSTVSAQNRIVLPQGSVIIVRTQTALQSSSLRQGQTFETLVDDTVRVDNYTVLPEGSRIQGIVTMAQPATRQQSGVLEVDFNQLILPDGTAFQIQGKLTSTDPTERRQIESTANQRVVLVGGRGGIGAAIAGAGAQNSSTSSLLGALGTLLSQGQDVSVPAGTLLAVQLEQPLTLRTRGNVLAPDAATIYTSAELIRAAQRALAAGNYYRGSIDGRMTYATQRALFEYQSDKNLTPTGNLDWRTAQLLGLNVAGGAGMGMALSPADAAMLRRSTQSIVARERQELGITGLGRLSTQRAYTDADLELWFALSAFADNASLYEQLVRISDNTNGTAMAARALVSAARRVDAALLQTRTSGQLRNEWTTIRSRVATIDPGLAQ